MNRQREIINEASKLLVFLDDMNNQIEAVIEMILCNNGGTCPKRGTCRRWLTREPSNQYINLYEEGADGCPLYKEWNENDTL